MAAPQTLESLGKRPFSFYPPVIGIDHNEWVFDKATWSEILVTNAKSGTEVWVPRRFLGEISKVDEPVMIVGLKRELEYKAGGLWPYERRVIEMPKAVNDYTRPPSPEPVHGPTIVSGMRLESGTESNIGKLIGAALVTGVVLCFIIIVYFRGKNDPNNVTFVPIVQQSVGLTGADDYHGVTRKLGPPKEDRWKSESGELQYRLMSYPDRGWFIILMGKDRESARYIGAMDEKWKPIDSVNLPHAGNTRSMLNRLPKF